MPATHIHSVSVCQARGESLGAKKLKRTNDWTVLHSPLRDRKERQRLLEIADKCPVHKTLESSSEIKTCLAE
ncbi:OsmC family protein [Halocynthiibacter namhaensis]|uniref:OsmC family protein n=1 Tax=Halocynthiibacter namhaensis TaxID=1290553 RepID=UPI0005791775|nr:hypothetical protein [Halocynthiibacter namhaensis]